MALTALMAYLVGSGAVWWIAPRRIFPGALIVTALLVAPVARIVVRRAGPGAAVSVLLGTALGGWLTLLLGGVAPSSLGGEEAGSSLLSLARSSLFSSTGRTLTAYHVGCPLLGALVGFWAGVIGRGRR
jgi:hypothetical protein